MRHTYTACLVQCVYTYVVNSVRVFFPMSTITDAIILQITLKRTG
jgi:hypothetical protein